MYKYVLQVRRQNHPMKMVGRTLGDMFQHVNGKSLHVLEDVSILEAPKPLTKKKQKELCNGLMAKVKADGTTDILGFKVVPYEESIVGRMERMR